MFKYSYGRSANSDEIMNTNITIPVNKEGEIDFEYMETYIKDIYTNSRLITNENKIELDKPEYREFKISDVFEMKNCKPYHSKDIVITDREGIPYITRT